MNAPASANPYVGPRSIETGEAFFGRDREVRSLISLLIAERIVLLHSPSGAGKSSLIQAGLIPGIRARVKFRILPVVRVNLEPPEGAANRFLLSMLLSLEEDRPEEERLPLADLAGMGLTAYLASRRQGEENLLLIFDQFEEILTTAPSDLPAKQAFFDQLEEALVDRHLWVLFAIREDYMGGLAPYARCIPNRLSVTFRLDLLGPSAARQAIQLPARGQGVDFTEAAAGMLIDDLSRVKVQQPDGTFESQSGQYVEPVQLQVVCYRLWETRQDGDGDISIEDLEKLGNVDQSLGEYYAASLQKAVEQTGVDEGSIRDWFEARLIAEGIRRQVLMGARMSEGLDNRVIRILEDAHLLRSEKRAGATWFELAHDRLLGPVHASNTAWAAANQTFLQRQAALWMEQGRPDSLVLHGRELDEMETEARTRTLSAGEQDYLKACRQHRKNEKDARRRRIITIAGIGAAVITVIIGLLSFSFYTQKNAAAAAELAAKASLAKSTAVSAQGTAMSAQAKAETQAALARAGELAGQAITQRNRNFQISLLLGVEAYRKSGTILTLSTLLDNAQANPRLEKFLPGEEMISSVDFSPDGKTLASGNEKNSIVLWDVTTGKPIGKPLTGHTNWVNSVDFSPTGKILASGSGDQTIILWDVSDPNNPKQISTLRGHTEAVESVAFSRDGKILASGSDDDTIILWDLKDLKNPVAIHTLTGHRGNVNSVAFSPDGQTLASGSDDTTVRLWDVARAELIGEPLRSHDTFVISVAFSPGGNLLASAGGDKDIKLWNVKDPVSPHPFGRLYGHTNSIISLAFSANGTILASGGSDHRIILWDVQKQEQIGDPLIGHTDVVTSVAFPQEGGTLASGSTDHSIILWDLAPKSPISRSLTSRGVPVSSVALSPDGRTLAWGDGDYHIHLQDVADPSHPKPMKTLEGHMNEVFSVAFSPDNKILASGSSDKSIILWNLEDPRDPKRLSTTPGHTESIYKVAFSPDGKTLASGGADKNVILWDVKDPAKPKRLRTLSGHTDAVYSIAFSPNGQILASGSTDNTIRLWDIKDLKHAVPLTSLDPGEWVFSVTFSPDGKTLAAGITTGTIYEWNVEDLENIKRIGNPLSGHTDYVLSLAYSPDGSILASGSRDHSIILWDEASQQPIGQPLIGHTDFAYSVIFAPNGKTLFSGGKDGAVILWDIDPNSWAERACVRAGRNFTRAEWEFYFPGEPYRATCTQWPGEPEAMPTPTIPPTLTPTLMQTMPPTSIRPAASTP